MSASAAEELPSEPRDENLKILEELLVDVTHKFFENCGVTIELTKTSTKIDIDHQHTGFAGIIGLASEVLRGNLVIYLGDDLVMVTRPETIDSGVQGHAAMADWTSEIANQVLGRLKNALLAYGCTISLSVPSSVSGVGYALTSLNMDTPRHFVFDSDHGQVIVVLSVQMHESLRLVLDESHEATEEGDLLLF